MEAITRQEAWADWASDWEDKVWDAFMAEHMPHLNADEFSRHDLKKIRKTNVGVVLYGLWDAFLWEANDE